MPLTDERLIRDGDYLLGPLLGHFDMNGLVVDIGCGYGRLAYALERKGFRGRYVGIDILPKQIAWLGENFTPACPNYEFAHFDVHNARYNPNGKLVASDLRLPEGPSLIALFSVFTHFKEDDIKTYLRLMTATMNADSLICGTCFLVNDEQSRFDAEGRSAFSMPHQLNGYTRYHSENDPLFAIGYDEQVFKSWIADAGLQVERTLYGAWCGRRNCEVYQDTLWLRKRV